MKNEERVQNKDCRADTTKVQESAQQWPHLIGCGIFKPETMPHTPFAKKCILDTYIQGWTPDIYRKSIKEWITVFSRATKNRTITKNIKEDITNLYKEIKQAIYIRAFTLKRLNRQIVADRKKQMATELKTPVKFAHTTQKSEISWDFGSREEPLSDADSNSKHEQEQQNREEPRD